MALRGRRDSRGSKRGALVASLCACAWGGLWLGVAGCGEPKSAAKAQDSPTATAARNSTGQDATDSDTPPAPLPAPDGGQISVFVRAEASKLGAPPTAGTDGAITLVLTGPNGTRIKTGAPVTWCGAVPGTWTVRAESPGYLPAQATVEVVDKRPTLVELELKAAGRLTLLPPPGHSGGMPAKLTAPGAEVARTIELPYRADHQPHGLYTLEFSLSGSKKTRSLAVMVPPTERVRVAVAPEGLVIGGVHHALANDAGAPVPVETFESKGRPSLYKVRRGRRTFRKRRYDLGPVRKLSELQWKVRSVIVHRHSGTIEDAMTGWVEAKAGRHLVVGLDGKVSQLLDLVEEAKAVGHLIDETTIHVSLATDGGAMRPAQQRALAVLLGTLSRLLPRVRPSFPIADGGGLVSERLVDPRAHKGWMMAHHVVAPASPSEAQEQSGAEADSAVSPTTGTPPDGTDASVEEPLDETAVSAKAMALFDRRVEVDTTGRTDDGFRSLTIRATATATAQQGAKPSDSAQAPLPRLKLMAPHGDEVTGAGIAVVCQPRLGRWIVEATALKHALERRRPAVVLPKRDIFEDIQLSRVGDVALAGKPGTEAVLSGPGGLEMAVTLPYEGIGLKAGHYRVAVARAEAKLQPYRMGFRIDADRKTRLTLPDIDDPTLPSVLIGGEPYPLPAGLKVVNYRHPDALSFYAAQVEIGDADRVYMQRALPSGRNVASTAEIASVTRMVVLHADVIKDTATTFKVLASKGLSTHFGIEWDGTIYQMLDPKDGAFAAAEVNPYSVQIDLNNMLPNLVKTPRARPYPRPHPRAKEMALPEFERPKSRRVVINGRDVKSYGYTDAQYRSLIALMRVLTGVLTRIDPEVPLNPNGTVPLDFFDGAEHFDGIIAHWHLTPRRWDPGPGFDWQRLRRGLAGQPE